VINDHQPRGSGAGWAAYSHWDLRNLPGRIGHRYRVHLISNIAPRENPLYEQHAEEEDRLCNTNLVHR
jgi:hypothetical protein